MRPDRLRARQHRLAEERACLGDVYAGFAVMLANKQHVLRAVVLILRNF
jgi:hypothetical protein